MQTFLISQLHPCRTISPRKTARSQPASGALGALRSCSSSVCVCNTACRHETRRGGSVLRNFVRWLMRSGARHGAHAPTAEDEISTPARPSACKKVYLFLRAAKKQTHTWDGNRESTFPGNLNGHGSAGRFFTDIPIKVEGCAWLASGAQQVSAEMSNPPAQQQLILIILPAWWVSANARPFVTFSPRLLLAGARNFSSAGWMSSCNCRAH